MAKWLDELGELTGEEVFHLVGRLNEAIALISVAPFKRKLTADQTQELNRLMVDALDIEVDVRMQVARITVPMREAQSTVYQRRFARGQMVKRAG